MCGGGDLFKVAALGAAAYFGLPMLAGETAAGGIAAADAVSGASLIESGAGLAAADAVGGANIIEGAVANTATASTGALGGGLKMAKDGVSLAAGLGTLLGGNKTPGNLTPEMPGKPQSAQAPQSPDYAAVRKQKGAAANPASTFLTGVNGVDPNKLNLGRTLLGGNDVLGA